MKIFYIPNEKVSARRNLHYNALALILLPDLGPRDTLSGSELGLQATFLEVLEPFAGFGEVLSCEELLAYCLACGMSGVG